MLPRNDQTQDFQYARLVMTYKIANEKVGITEKDKESRHMQINVRENRKDSQEWTIQRHWHHWVHKTK